MTEFSPELEKLIRKSHDAICQLHDAMLGIDGQGGIMKRVDLLEHNYAKLNRNFWMLVCLLIGLGIIGGSLFGIFR
jgi:hypothetical protein